MKQAPRLWIESEELRDKTAVFEDRADAGRRLAQMLGDHLNSDALVLAVPRGGVPVAAPIAQTLNLEIDLIVASKITPAWNTEVGYGAVTFDGSYELNREFVARLGLTEEEIHEGIVRTHEKVLARHKRFRGDRSFPQVASRDVIVVDDGLATGFTMEVAIRALRKKKPARIVVAVPTAHEDSARRIGEQVDALHCPNIRTGRDFAVAAAYVEWHDVTDEEVFAALSEAVPEYAATGETRRHG